MRGHLFEHHDADRHSVPTGYVTLRVAQKMVRAFRDRSSAHEYDRMIDNKLFAEQLTQDLFETGHDHHIKVFQPGSRDARNSMLALVSDRAMEAA